MSTRRKEKLCFNHREKAEWLVYKEEKSKGGKRGKK